MRRFSARVLAHLGFCLSAIVIVAMCWALYEASGRLGESLRWVSHTQATLQATAEISAALSRAESAQRGYHLTGSDIFLAERDQALAKGRDATAWIKTLTADNVAQQARITRLEAALAARVAMLHDNERLRRTAGLDAARETVAAGAGQRVSAAAHALVAELKQEELQLLELRRADAEQRRAVDLGILAAVLVTAVLVLIPGYLGFASQARKREEAQLQRDRFFTLSLDLLCIAGTDGYFKRINPAFSAALGHGAEEIMAQPFLDLVHPEDRPATLAELENLGRGVHTIEFENRYRCKDGSWKWLSWKAHPVKKEKLIYATARDVTERRQMERQLIAARDEARLANRAKSAFLAAMSHEIRTPMNGVLGMLELLSLTRLDAAQRTTLEVVRESGKSLLRIIDDILDFSKIEAGRLEVRPEAASIRAIVDAVHNLYAGTASSKGLLIERSVDPQISPAVRVDPLRLRQILNNFVSNALKFTDRGTITIKAELIERAAGDDRIRFSVTDTGIGISAENQQKLFQPFMQAQGDTAQRYGGSGLGLAICQRLAGMMGGSIEMASESGKGTVMNLVLSLPVADPKDLPSTVPQEKLALHDTAAAMRRLAPGIREAELEGTLILLVDDHPTNRHLLERQATTLGYAAEAAENGREALEKWKSGRYGIVITDCNMPEMDGYALARAIRALEFASGGKRTPIIACTANALAGEAEACLAAGMDDYLVKPVELKALLKKLDQWLPIPATEPVEIAGPALDARLPDANTATPLDRSALAEIAGGDAAAERDILIDFRQVNDRDAAVLTQAVANRDMTRAARAAHRIKGASRMVGATGLAGVCERIESACHDNDWPAIAANMGAFQREWLCLNAHLDAY